MCLNRLDAHGRLKYFQRQLHEVCSHGHKASQSRSPPCHCATQKLKSHPSTQSYQATKCCSRQILHPPKRKSWGKTTHDTPNRTLLGPLQRSFQKSDSIQNRAPNVNKIPSSPNLSLIETLRYWGYPPVQYFWSLVPHPLKLE